MVSLVSADDDIRSIALKGYTICNSVLSVIYIFSLARIILTSHGDGSGVALIFGIVGLVLGFPVSLALYFFFEIWLMSRLREVYFTNLALGAKYAHFAIVLLRSIFYSPFIWLMLYLDFLPFFRESTVVYFGPVIYVFLWIASFAVLGSNTNAQESSQKSNWRTRLFFLIFMIIIIFFQYSYNVFGYLRGGTYRSEHFSWLQSGGAIPKLVIADTGNSTWDNSHHTIFFFKKVKGPNGAVLYEKYLTSIELQFNTYWRYTYFELRKDGQLISMSKIPSPYEDSHEYLNLTIPDLKIAASDVVEIIPRKGKSHELYKDMNGKTVSFMFTIPVVP